MNQQHFSDYLNERKAAIDRILPTLINRLNAPNVLKESMIYSLNAGGKRLRPILLLATTEAFGCEDEVGLAVACAIEMIHTYSLIHDDLPAMDDDDLRRGKPTNHKVFGEATAILAGDALLTESFRVIAEADGIDMEKKLRLIAGLAKAAGAEGMVGGQVADMEAEGKRLEVEELEYIHLHKTGKLLAFSITAGAILADAAPEKVKSLEQFAIHLGLAFQIKDDILDVEGNESVIGKPVGSDSSNQKSTYPNLLGLSQAKIKCSTHLASAKKYLLEAGIKHQLLEQISDYIVNRDH